MNQYEKSAVKNKTPDEEIVEVDRGQASTTPNTGQTSTPKKSRYIDCFALFRSVIQRCIIYTYYIKKNLLIQKRINTKNPQQKINHPIKKSSKWIVDKLQLLLIPDKLLPPKKVDILIVLRYSVPLFKGVLTISKKFINTETNQYEKSAANRDELSDEVEIVKVARGQTSTTPATGQVYQKNYRDLFVLDISQVLMESRQKSKTSQDLEESHTDKEMASAHFPKSSFEHTRTIKPQELSLSRMPHRDSLSREFLPYDFSSSSVEPSESLAYRYNNSDYEKLKRGNEL
ncbi:uncharacterized protein OCT59_020135 [Rhizophagus irregularis]|uniref:uncharacterized protein n=1 Tax=Rhizophagus irregularis TaxID=588596 RepID=UPI00331A2682|nr:hypothetical protein OCT59_020135 [Rhizophagus irregularis]